MVTESKKHLYLQDNDMLFWTDKNNETEYALWIQTDTEPCHPRNDCINMDIMFCLHPRYTLGDERPETTFTEFWENIAAECMPAADLVKSYLKNKSITDNRIADIQNLTKDHLVYLPIWLYDHSGISISCGERTYPYNDAFDSSLLGYIVMFKTTAIRDIGYKETEWKQKATEYMRHIIERYNQYLNDEIYAYTMYKREMENPVIKNQPNNTLESDWDEIESCSNFYGADLLSNGILDNVDLIEPNFKTAIESGKYTTGCAKQKKIITWNFQKNRK